MAMDREEQALLLFTNRLLLDWISIAIDTGAVTNEQVERLIDFSVGQVVQGAPWLADETRAFADVTKSRLPTMPGDGSSRAG
jgi:hypothetical protein